MNDNQKLARTNVMSIRIIPKKPVAVEVIPPVEQAFEALWGQLRSLWRNMDTMSTSQQDNLIDIINRATMVLKEPIA